VDTRGILLRAIRYANAQPDVAKHRRNREAERLSSRGLIVNADLTNAGVPSRRERPVD